MKTAYTSNMCRTTEQELPEKKASRDDFFGLTYLKQLLLLIKFRIMVLIPEPLAVLTAPKQPSKKDLFLKAVVVHAAC